MKFSFILGPITIKQLKDAWPIMRLVPEFIVNSSGGIIPPFKILRKRLRSGTGIEAQGYLILCPLLRRQEGGLSEASILDKIVSAGRIAEQLHSDVVGLGGYGSLLSAEDYNKFAKGLKIPVTNGNALTAWSVVEAVYRAARIKGISLEASIIAIAGIDTCIGRLCALKLSEFTRQPVIDGRQGLLKADIVVNISGPDETPIDINNLKQGAILCDVSAAGSLSGQAKSRPDITYMEAGLVKLPSGDIVSAGMAEAMLLALERRFVSYSSAGDINPDKAEEIAGIAARHGLEIYAPAAPLQ